MRVTLSSEQEFFRATTARFLTQHAPPDRVRALRDAPDGFSSETWRRGADLGWTSLLVAEEHGGGSISGEGLVDLTLVAHEFGRHAAPGPLVPTNLVAGALSRSGVGEHRDLLDGLLAGTAIAAWAHGEPGPGGFPRVDATARDEGDEVVLDGVKRPVESAAVASHLLVTARTDDGLTQVVVPTSTPGVVVEPLRSLDLTRRFATVRLDSVRVPRAAVVGEIGEAVDDVERQTLHALVLAAAESVGAMEHGFELTVQWAFDRYSFGRPLASYQELKHRFADMKTWLEAAHAVTDAAAVAVERGAPDAALLACAAQAYVGGHGSELLQDCVQIHGGIGLTFEHDLHLFLRRQVLNRELFGSPVDHHRRIAAMLERRAVA